MHKAIFYDLDNTLYNQKMDIKQRVEYCCKTYGLCSKIMNYWYKQWLDKGPLKRDIVDKVIDEFNITVDKKELLDAYRNFQTDLSLSSEIRKMLLDFKKQNILQFLITNGSAKGQYYKIKKLGLDKILNKFVLAAGKNAKPSPYWYNKIMKIYNLSPEECLSVGDWYCLEGKASEKAKIKFIYIENDLFDEKIDNTVVHIKNILEIIKFYN